MASLAYDEISLIVKYTQPSAIQHLPLPERHDFCLLDKWIYKNHRNMELLSKSFALYTMELELRRHKPIDYEPFTNFIAGHLHHEVLTVQGLVILSMNCRDGSPQFTTMQELLKGHAVPSHIPSLEKIFKRYHIFISALSAFSAGIGSHEIMAVEEFSPFWGQLVLQRLFPESRSPVPFSLPIDVKQQAEFYLDPKRPLLLYKFKADQ